MNYLSGAFKFFAAGGIWVIPIVVVGVVGLGIAIERYFIFFRAVRAHQRTWDEIQPVLHQGDFNKAREITRDDKSALAMLVNVGIENQGVVRRRNDIELAMEEVMQSIVPQFQKRVSY